MAKLPFGTFAGITAVSSISDQQGAECQAHAPSSSKSTCSDKIYVFRRDQGRIYSVSRFASNSTSSRPPELSMTPFCSFLRDLYDYRIETKTSLVLGDSVEVCTVVSRRRRATGVRQRPLSTGHRSVLPTNACSVPGHGDTSRAHLAYGYSRVQGKRPFWHAPDTSEVHI